MSPRPDFRAASEAAEQTLEYLLCAQKCAEEGRNEEARRIICAISTLASSFGEVFDEMQEQLASVAEGKIARYGPNGTQYFASAHAAMSSLWLTITLVCLKADPVRPDLIDWLGIETSALRALLIRERARISSDFPKKVVAPLPTIYFHGEQSYSSDGRNPIKVSSEQHSILQSFLDKEVAQDTKALQKLVNNVSVVVTKIEKICEGAVNRPTAKGSGYFIRVRSLATK